MWFTLNKAVLLQNKWA